MATWNGQIAVAEWYALGGVVAPGPTVPTAPQYNLLPPPQQQHHQPQQPSAEQPQQQQPMLQQLPQPQQLQQGNVHGLATPMPMRPVRQLPAQYGGAVPSFDASPISAHHATLISTHLIPRVAVAAAPPIGSSTAGGSVASPHTVIASSPSQPVPASISARDASGHTVAQLTLEGNTVRPAPATSARRPMTHAHAARPCRTHHIPRARSLVHAAVASPCSSRDRGS